MWKLLSLLFALVASSNAVIRYANFTSGYIIQGRDASGVTVDVKNGKQQITWKENFDKENSLKIYAMHVYEDSGLVETVELNNLCDSYQRGSFEYTIKYFVLTKLAYTLLCPIKKRTATISYPVTLTYQAGNRAAPCGPLIAITHIIRNHEADTDNTPLLISAMFRGTITGSYC